MESGKSQAPPENRLITALRSCSDGEFLPALDSQMKELIGAACSTGKRGKLMLTISVTPTKKGGLLEIDARATLKLPSVEPSSTFLYTDDNDYSLSREDPRQPKLPGVGPAEVKSFARAATGESHE